MLPKGEFTLNEVTVHNTVLNEGKAVLAASLAGTRNINGMYILFSDGATTAPANTADIDSTWYTQPPTGYGAIRIPVLSAPTFSGTDNETVTLYASSAAKTSADYGVAFAAGVKVLAYSLASMPVAATTTDDLLYNLAVMDNPAIVGANAELLVKASITC